MINQAPLEPARTTELILPPEDPGKLPAVKRYLTDERAIAPSLIRRLIESGRLYADTRGNAVFLLLEKENRPVGAELRGTSSARWRGMAPGSQRDLGYFSVPAPGATTVILCESAIDAISCLELHPMLPVRIHFRRQGKPKLAPLAAFASAVKSIAVSIPTRPARPWPRNMMALHPGIRRFRPSQHDWNDVLKQYRTQQHAALLIPI